MSSSETGGRSLLKTGCIGCGAVLGLLLLAGVIMAGLGYMRAQSEDVQERQLEPAVASAVAGQGETPRPEPGRLVLDVKVAEFRLKPGAPGERLRIDARYDQNAFELRENLRPTAGEIGGWVYEVTLEPTGSPLMAMIKQAFSRNDPKLDVWVPPDLPVELEVAVDSGGGILELGGLWIPSADFRLEKGGVVIEIGEPLVEPMESLQVAAHMGGFAIERLGNASPRRFDLELRMSGGDLDLRGEWVTDSQIGLTWKRGGLSVNLPYDTGVEGLDPDTYGEFLREAGEGEPTLSFELDGKPDDIQFSR